MAEAWTYQRNLKELCVLKCTGNPLLYERFLLRQKYEKWVWLYESGVYANEFIWSDTLERPSV